MRKRLLFLFAVAAGLGTAVLRAFFLMDAVEPDTGLIRPGISLTFVLPLVAFLCGAVLLIAAMRDAPPKRAVLSRAGNAWRVAELLTALLLAAFGVYQIIIGFGGQYARLALGALALLAAFVQVYLAERVVKGNAVLSGSGGIWASIPVFFFCAAMIMNFWEHAGEPAVSLYIYGTLTIVFAALSRYGVSGFFFRCGKHSLTLFYTLAALMLSILTVGGSLLAQVLSSVELHPYALLTLPRLLLYGAIFVQTLSTAFGINLGVYDFGIPQKKPESPSEPPETESIDELLVDYLLEDMDENNPSEE